jgi:hypothetical protein
MAVAEIQFHPANYVELYPHSVLFLQVGYLEF